MPDLRQPFMSFALFDDGQKCNCRRGTRLNCFATSVHNRKIIVDLDKHVFPCRGHYRFRHWHGRNPKRLVNAALAMSRCYAENEKTKEEKHSR
jgi:hypothetical protein